MKTEAGILWATHEAWSVEEVELDGPRENELLVRLAASGLCHSDEHAVTGDIPQPLPIVGGHEGAGIVEDVGPGVRGIKKGDHVVLSFIPACGQCRWCAIGRSNLCELIDSVFTGLPISDGTYRIHARGQGIHTLGLLGTFSPYVVVHETSAIKIDDDIPLDVASLVGCGVTTGWGSVVHIAEARPGETIVIVGAGGIGISAVQAARVVGAEKIVAVDPVPYKRQQAELFGATHTAGSFEEATELVQELTKGRMADAAVLTAGLADGSMVQPLLSLVGRGGRAVVTSSSSPTVQQVDLALCELVFTEKQLRGNVYGGARLRDDMPTLISLYRSGQLKLDEMVTSTYSLAELNDGYDDLRAGKNVRGLIKFAS